MRASENKHSQGEMGPLSQPRVGKADSTVFREKSYMKGNDSFAKYFEMRLQINNDRKTVKMKFLRYQ